MNNKQYKKVLITGALGFIGHYAVKKYTEEGYFVIGIDNLSNNCVDLNHEYLNGSEIIISDITKIDPASFKDIDLVLHLASPIGTVALLGQSGDIAKTIIKELYWAIEVSKLNSCPIIFTSTCEIYGSVDSLQQIDEDYPKTLSGKYSVRNEYSIAKLLCEIVLENTNKKDLSFKYQIVRPFNVIGKGQKPNSGHVVPRFVEQAKNNIPVTVYGDGSQERAFTHVSDMVNAIFLLSVTKEHWNNIWNIGNPNNKININTLAKIVVEFFNSKSEIVFVDPKKVHGPLFEDAPAKIPNSEKVRSLLGWHPIKDIYEILKEINDV